LSNAQDAAFGSTSASQLIEKGRSAMIVTKKSLARRTVLRGMGATLALPILDAMVPAFSTVAKTAARPIPRLGVIYLGSGMGGPRGENWTPASEGPRFELTPILEPLAAFRDQLLVVSGLSNPLADAGPGEGSGDHSRSPAAFLTGCHPKKTEGADLRVCRSMDQIAAERLGQETQLASLELALESELVGICGDGYSCAYKSTISWRSPTTPLPMEIDPRAVFERLFGSAGSTEARARLARIRDERSILDLVLSKLSVLQQSLGTDDRTKLTEYVDAIRDVERRIQKAEEQSAKELPIVEQPAGVPATFEEHAKLMFDLQVLAFQCDLTRVI